jgi:uncharacterized protein
MGKFTLFKGKDNQFYFHLKANNNEKVLASEGYTHKQGCLNGIDSVKRNAPYDSNYGRRNALNGQYYFVLKASNGEVIGTSETYTTAQARDHGIEVVKKEAPNASTEDLT